MTILFSTNIGGIGGIEIKLTKFDDHYLATSHMEHGVVHAVRCVTYAEASKALGSAIAHAIEQLHGSENLP